MVFIKLNDKMKPLLNTYYSKKTDYELNKLSENIVRDTGKYNAKTFLEKYGSVHGLIDIIIPQCVNGIERPIISNSLILDILDILLNAQLDSLKYIDIKDFQKDRFEDFILLLIYSGHNQIYIRNIFVKLLATDSKFSEKGVGRAISFRIVKRLYNNNFNNTQKIIDTIQSITRNRIAITKNTKNNNIILKNDNQKKITNTGTNEREKERLNKLQRNKIEFERLNKLKRNSNANKLRQQFKQEPTPIVSKPKSFLCRTIGLGCKRQQ